MARILWFGLGFLGGMTYASRLIHKEHLDMPAGAVQTTEIQVEKTDSRSFQEKLADRVEEQAERLGDMVAFKGRKLIDTLSTQLDHQGHVVAKKLREQGQQKGTGTPRLRSTQPMASTDYASGTASLPMDQQVLRDDQTTTQRTQRDQRSHTPGEMASTTFPAGTASLPAEQRALRDDAGPGTNGLESTR